MQHLCSVAGNMKLKNKPCCDMMYITPFSPLGHCSCFPTNNAVLATVEPRSTGKNGQALVNWGSSIRILRMRPKLNRLNI